MQIKDMRQLKNLIQLCQEHDVSVLQFGDMRLQFNNTKIIEDNQPTEKVEEVHDDSWVNKLSPDSKKSEDEIMFWSAN